MATQAEYDAYFKSLAGQQLTYDQLLALQGFMPLDQTNGGQFRPVGDTSQAFDYSDPNQIRLNDGYFFDPQGQLMQANPDYASSLTTLTSQSGDYGLGNGTHGAYDYGLTFDPQTGQYTVGDPTFREISNHQVGGTFFDQYAPLIAGAAITGGALGLFGAGGAPAAGALGMGADGMGAMALGTDAGIAGAGAGAAGFMDTGLNGIELGGSLEQQLAGEAAAAAGGGAGAGLLGDLNAGTILAGGAVASSLLNKPSTPDAPNYAALAQQQADQQQALIDQQTAANRFNQVTPYGSLTWSQDANGNWTQTQTLSPDQQAILNQQNALSLGLGTAQNSMLGQVTDTYSQPFTGGDAAARQQTIDSQYAAMASRLDPQWAQRESALNTRLANQGISAGSEAYANALREFGNQRNDAYQQANNSALQLGNQEFQNSFNRNLTSYQLPMNLFNSLRTGSQVQNPNFQNQNTSASLGQSPNLLGAAGQQYGASLDATNANNAWNSNLTNGLFSLAGSYYGQPTTRR